MPIDFIPIDPNIVTAKYANDLIAFVRGLRTVIDAIDKVNGIIAHNNDGANNYADVEKLFGLPTGQGKLVANTLTTVQGQIDNPTTRGVIDRLG